MFASDPTGVVMFLVFFGLVVPWLSLNLVALLVFAFRGKYRGVEFSAWHSMAIALGPLAALIIQIAYSSSAPSGFNLVVYAMLFLFALLPLIVHVAHKHA